MTVKFRASLASLVRQCGIGGEDSGVKSNDHDPYENAGHNVVGLIFRLFRLSRTATFSACIWGTGASHSTAEAFGDSESPRTLDIRESSRNAVAQWKL